MLWTSPSKFVKSEISALVLPCNFLDGFSIIPFKISFSPYTNFTNFGVKVRFDLFPHFGIFDFQKAQKVDTRSEFFMAQNHITEHLQDPHSFVHIVLIKLATIALFGHRRNAVARILPNQRVPQPQEVPVPPLDLEAIRSSADLVSNEVRPEQTSFHYFWPNR